MIGRPHPILAAIANWYFLAAICGAVVATLCAVVQRTPPILWSLVFAPLLLIAAVVYQWRSRRVPWLSPGELIAGRDIDDVGQKRWVNPWLANRWALNTVLFTALVLSGNTWDGLFEGRLYPAGKIIVNVALLGALWGGVITAGKGHTGGVAVVAGFYLLLGTIFTVAPNVLDQTPVEFNRVFGYGLLSWAAISFAVAVVYHRLRETRSGMAAAETAL